MTEETYFTTEELLAYLQLNLRTVYRLIKAGKIPAAKIGRQWRFRKADLDAWLEANRRATRVSTARAARATGRPHILVVDDERAIRELLLKVLEATTRYDVDTAPDGATALDKLATGEYDLLVTDLRMPGMDGLSVIREAHLRVPDLPVVIITGHSTEASAIEAVNMGVSGYITKPFRTPRILGAVARALGEPEPAPAPSL